VCILLPTWGTARLLLPTCNPNLARGFAPRAETLKEVNDNGGNR
jgi:hypothetical protein